VLVVVAVVVVVGADVVGARVDGEVSTVVVVAGAAVDEVTAGRVVEISAGKEVDVEAVADSLSSPPSAMAMMTRTNTRAMSPTSTARIRVCRSVMPGR
jgi:hypothetical protein